MRHMQPLPQQHPQVPHPACIVTRLSCSDTRSPASNRRRVPSFTEASLVFWHSTGLCHLQGKQGVNHAMCAAGTQAAGKQAVIAKATAAGVRDGVRTVRPGLDSAAATAALQAADFAVQAAQSSSAGKHPHASQISLHMGCRSAGSRSLGDFRPVVRVAGILFAHAMMLNCALPSSRPMFVNPKRLSAQSTRHVRCRCIAFCRFHTISIWCVMVQAIARWRPLLRCKPCRQRQVTLPWPLRQMAAAP